MSARLFQAFINSLLNKVAGKKEKGINGYFLSLYCMAGMLLVMTKKLSNLD